MGILALGADERVSSVQFTDEALSVMLKDGRTITVPLVWVPHTAPRNGYPALQLENCRRWLRNSLARSR